MTVFPYGVQLHTVRTELQKDFVRTIEKVASIGYTEVEFAGYFNHPPKEIRQLLDRLRLTAPGIHVPYNSINDSLRQTIDDALILGHRYIILPGVDENLRRTIDDWKRIAESLNRAGEISRKSGVQMAYHNHEAELLPINRIIPYHLLLEECAPELVSMEMDVYWIIVGGHDPNDYLSKYPGRFPLLHLKDAMKAKLPPGKDINSIPLRDRFIMSDVGSGIIDWRQVLDTAAKTGVKHCFVEHDHPSSPIESIKISHAYLGHIQ
jgi:sugar phosphate isomerase/epimerase